MLQVIKNALTEYQKSYRLNLMGERDGYKHLGSFPGMVIFGIGLFMILSYFGYLLDYMYTLQLDQY